MKLVYIASPYSHERPQVMQRRYEAVLAFVTRVMQSGEYIAFSPIVYCHEMAKKYNLPTDSKFWRHINHGFLSNSDEMWILMLDGWDKSVGVNDEIAAARSMLKPTYHKCPRGMNYPNRTWRADYEETSNGICWSIKDGYRSHRRDW